MHFIIIQDETRKEYYVLKTPFLPEFYSIIKRKSGRRYKLKVFENKYAERLVKLFYVKFLLRKKYKYRRKVLNEFLSGVD